MMKFLDEIEKKNKDAVVQQTRGIDFQKRNLLKSVGDFTMPVLSAIERWLFSFPTGMTRDMFDRQMRNIDKDEAIALTQLKDAHGFRVIKKNKEKHPELKRSFMECVASEQYCLTITGSKSACQEYVMRAIKDLQSFGSVYVFDSEVYFSNFRSLKNKGNADELISAATKCDFLIIENLAQNIGLVSTVSCLALVNLVNFRHGQKKPTLCRLSTYKHLQPIYEKCPIYEVGNGR